MEMSITAFPRLSGIVECLCIFFLLEYASANCNPSCNAAPNTNSGLACNDTTLECLYGCHQGYGGERCQFRCADNCLNCTTDSCNGDCNATCDNITCNQTEACIQGCVSGFYGQNCTLPCPNHCLNSTCEREIGTCLLGCENDFFGNTCDKTCSPYCVEAPPNTTNTACNVTTLACLYGCKGNFDGDQCDTCRPGWTGGYCSVTCSYNCLDCTLDGQAELSSPSGDDTVCHQCALHHFNNDNSCEPCSDNCRQNVASKKSQCNEIDGYCEFGCEDGYYGPKCDRQCNSNCLENFASDLPTCDSQNGTCTFGCIGDRTYGPMCDKFCGYLCINHVCDREGTCRGCRFHSYGPRCNQTCSENCVGDKSKNIEICTKNDGFCVQGCKAGKYGITCSDDCPENCNGNMCNRTSGHCIDKCKKGFYGEDCGKRCSPNCLDHGQGDICFFENGTCTSENCAVSWFGPSCKKKCSLNCMNNVCDRNSGFCSNGCAVGHFGNTCEAVEDYTEKQTYLVAIIFPSVAGLFLLVTAIMIMVTIWKCRKNIKCFKSWKSGIRESTYENNEMQAATYNEMLTTGEAQTTITDHLNTDGVNNEIQKENTRIDDTPPPGSIESEVFNNSKQFATGGSYEELQKRDMTNENCFTQFSELSTTNL